ncbi:hypothetical protein L284_17020 [Novosphingobium lindaniclasticum LE124]|uniref:Uncharacterized protein n=1 Tax=Novosphingobium lindaniclasticum LE124 TaxID=1096930 RepID=T0H235_9SPHN|nr:hypothetical protein L284_17020 [Novosphingobium lindaniclasticum LE124]
MLGTVERVASGYPAPALRGTGLFKAIGFALVGALIGSFV